MAGTKLACLVGSKEVHYEQEYDETTRLHINGITIVSDIVGQ